MPPKFSQIPFRQRRTKHVMSSAPPPPRASRRKKTVRTVRAIYAYTAQQADELTFPEGALLYVLRDDGDWWECRCGHQQGLVPSNYRTSMCACRVRVCVCVCWRNVLGSCVLPGVGCLRRMRTCQGINASISRLVGESTETVDNPIHEAAKRGTFGSMVSTHT